MSDVGAFDLSTAQRVLLDSARRGASERFRALAAAGEDGRVNRALVRALGDEGFLSRVFPGDGEGSVSAMDLCLMREGLAQECTEAETALALQGLGAHPIFTSATDELRRRWIPDVARGKAVAAFALSEPESGSDPAALSLRATRDGDGWRLCGTKTWISNAPEADVYSLFARTSDDGARGVTAFVVPGDASGLSGEAIAMLAPHAVGRLTLDDVRVGADHVLGEVGQGFKVAMKTLDLFRPSVGAFAVGMAQSALEASVAHSATRVQGGALLKDHQAIAHQLADMATEIEAARLLVYRAASNHDALASASMSGGGAAAGAARNTKLAAMAKLFATEVAQRAVDRAIQIHGASGLVRGHLLEHLYREVRAPRIYEGTSEIQRSIIARELHR